MPDCLSFSIVPVMTNIGLHLMLCFCFAFPRLVYPILLVSLDCTSWITPSVFSNVYLFITKIKI